MIKRTNRCEHHFSLARFICFSFAILLTSGFTTSKEENGSSGLKKQDQPCFLKHLQKLNRCVQTLSMNKFLIVGRLWFLKAQLFLGDLIDLNGK